MYRLKEFVNIEQPDGHTCGPTCIKMILNHLEIKSPSIYNIIGDLNFDVKNLAGAPYFRMEHILFNNNIKFKTLVDERLDELKSKLKNNLIILSVLIDYDNGIIFGNGYKHWVVVYDYDDKENIYYISDPWLGNYELNTKDIIKLTEPRNFLYIEIPINNTIGINKYKLDNVFDLISKEKMKLVFDSNFLFDLNGSEYDNLKDIKHINNIDYFYSFINHKNFYPMAKSIINDDIIYINMLNNNIFNKMKKYCNLTTNRAF